MNSFFSEVVVEHGLEENRFDREVLNQDELYQSINCEIDSITEEYDSLKLTKEQRKTISLMLDLYNESGARYGACAYAQGWFDCFGLLKSLWEQSQGDCSVKMGEPDGLQQPEKD